MRLRVLFVSLIVSTFGFASGASATSVALNNCDAFGCQGSSISLDVVSDGSGGWDITLGIDSTNYTGSKTGVVQAGFKAISGYTSVSLVSATDGLWSQASASGVSSSGLCNGNSNNDFVCTSGYADVATDTSSTWVFHVVGGTELPTSSWSLKFQYGNTTPERNGKYNGNIISAPGGGEPPIPEPSAALVFAAGLLTVASLRRRQR